MGCYHCLREAELKCDRCGAPSCIQHVTYGWFGRLCKICLPAVEPFIREMDEAERIRYDAMRENWVLSQRERQRIQWELDAPVEKVYQEWVAGIIERWRAAGAKQP